MSKSWMVSLLALVALAGCSKIMPKLDQVLPDNRVEYRKSKSMPDLEVPPDLTTDAIRDRMAIPEGGDTATFSTYQERVAERKREQELETSANEAIKVLENEHILAVEGAPKQVWPQLRSSMGEAGYQLELNDEELGIIETVWQENQEELARDKYKIFVEAGQEAGTTVLYISHRGEELVSQGGKMVWQPRTRDVARERALVDNLQAQLSGKPAAAVAAPAPAAPALVPESSKPVAEPMQDAGDTAAAADTGGAPAEAYGHAELISAGGGKVYLAVLEDFSAAWRSTGMALQRAGITVDQSDKSRGIYFIRIPATEGEVRKQGVLSKLKFWGDDDEYELQLSLTGVGDKTELVVLDKEGRWETGDISAKILNRLHDELNKGGG